MKQNIFDIPYLRIIPILVLPFILLGCQAIVPIKETPPSASALQHAYDYRLINSQTRQFITVEQLSDRLIDYDVIFIGEFHGNHASHLLEMQLISSLFQKRGDQIISLEMFNRDQQTNLNRYLDGEIGEVYLVKKTPAWSNYVASYRPIIEHAKQRFIPVIAANAAADVVRCIGREGKPYLSKLSEQETGFIAENPFTDNKAYRTRYMEFLEDARSLDHDGKERSYLAQLTRDNTMAESILTAKQENPGAQIIHLNGSFHSESHLGTVAALKQRQPDLKIAVINPVGVDNPEKPSFSDEDLKTGDYIYLLQPQPEQYKDAAYRIEMRKAMFKKSRSKAESCK